MATVKIGKMEIEVNDDAIPAVIRSMLDDAGEAAKYKEWWLDERKTVKGLMEEIDQLKKAVDESKDHFRREG
jgi:hypothetical protein